MANYCNHYTNHKNRILETLFYVFVDTNEIIRKYAVIEETDISYMCYNEFTRIVFVIAKTDAYKSKENLKFHKFTIRVNERPMKKRRKYLESTKQIVFRDRYLKEFPEKLI